MKRWICLLLSLVLVFSAVVGLSEPAAATNTGTDPEPTTGEPAETVITEPEETEPEETEPEETEPEETEPEETEPEETEPEQTGMRTSDELVALLKFEEGFCKYPVWDYSQYTVGYGTRCPSDMVSYYSKHGITDAEAEALLRGVLQNTENLINVRLIEKYGLNMTQGQFDALISFSYNMGGGWITTTSSNIHKQVAAGATGNEIIDALCRWCNAGGEIKSFLIRRRLSESYMYLEGQYAHTPPDYYCYVLYSGNGGSAGQKIQGYNAKLNGPPTGTATNGDYKFVGWYTERNGGVKVETLTQDLDGMTLYAHWEGMEYEEPELFDEPIEVKVTANSVNLRKGPGTNYSRVGTAHKDDVYEIWQVQEGGSYTWGYYKSGWIALQYTNYDSVISGEEPAEPEETEPEETEPEVTEPEATEPAKPKVIYGVVNADPYLCVRSAPGTNNPTVGTLANGKRVEITEQKVVGSVTWGKTTGGWISMDYVTLEEDFESEVDQGSTTGKTGTVTCSKLNVRSGAGVSYDISGSYYKGDTVVITEEKTVGTTTWGKTAKGWVSMDYISLKQTETTPPAEGGNSGETEKPAEVKGTVISSDVLRIRSGADGTYSVVGYLDPGTVVTILEQKTVGNTTWGKISKGWISMDYVKIDGQAEPEEEEKPSSIRGTVSADPYLCVRTGPGTSYATVDKIYTGEVVYITEKKTVGSTVWGKTEKGWVSLNYVELEDTESDAPVLPEDEFEDPTNMVRTVNVNTLLIRAEAGTNNREVGYLRNGDKVTVTQVKEVNGHQWGKISTGWICLTYTV